MSRTSRTFRTLLIAGAWLFAQGRTPAATPLGDVAGVLATEGDFTAKLIDRRPALESIRNSQDSAEAWWQSGFVKVGDEWTAFDATARSADSLLQKYRTWRAASADTAADELQLADRCRDAGLADQERAHLTRALLAGNAPAPEKILKRLGYRQVGNRWLTEREVQEIAAQARQTIKAWQKLQPRLEKLVVRLEGSSKQRETALHDLKSLTTMSTLPVWEQFVAPVSESAALAVVAVMSEISSYRTSQPLARLALFSPWKTVRTAAMDELERRPLEQYVPTILDFMQLPISTQLQLDSDAVDNWTRIQHNQLLFRFLLTQERRESVQMGGIYGVVGRLIPIDNVRLVGIDLERVNVDAFRAVSDIVYEAVSAADDLNEQTKMLNQRASLILATVTKQPESDDPRVWWNWWDQITDTPRRYAKPIDYVYEELYAFGRPHGSCLVAGTPIWTESGFVAVEKILPGDRVLSKNIETGELAYKPVLRTTQRAKAALRKVTVGDDSFLASPGHNFWISGRGWTRINQMEEPSPAHTVTGTCQMTAEDVPNQADVFNLVVADFHTYFVGKSMILSHDVVPPEPTDYKVPGLKPAVDVVAESK